MANKCKGVPYAAFFDDLDPQLAGQISQEDLQELSADQSPATREDIPVDKNVLRENRIYVKDLLNKANKFSYPKFAVYELLNIEMKKANAHINNQTDKLSRARLTMTEGSKLIALASPFLIFGAGVINPIILPFFGQLGFFGYMTLADTLFRYAIGFGLSETRGSELNRIRRNILNLSVTGDARTSGQFAKWNSLASEVDAEMATVASRINASRVEVTDRKLQEMFNNNSGDAQTAATLLQLLSLDIGENRLVNEIADKAFPDEIEATKASKIKDVIYLVQYYTADSENYFGISPFSDKVVNDYVNDISDNLPEGESMDLNSFKESINQFREVFLQEYNKGIKEEVFNAVKRDKNAVGGKTALNNWAVTMRETYGKATGNESVVKGSFWYQGMFGQIERNTVKTEDLGLYNDFDAMQKLALMYTELASDYKDMSMRRLDKEKVIDGLTGDDAYTEMNGGRLKDVPLHELRKVIHAMQDKTGKVKKFFTSNVYAPVGVDDISDFVEKTELDLRAEKLTPDILQGIANEFKALDEDERRAEVRRTFYEGKEGDEIDTIIENITVNPDLLPQLSSAFRNAYYYQGKVYTLKKKLSQSTASEMQIKNINNTINELPTYFDGVEQRFGTEEGDIVLVVYENRKGSAGKVPVMFYEKLSDLQEDALTTPVQVNLEDGTKQTIEVRSDGSGIFQNNNNVDDAAEIRDKVIVSDDGTVKDTDGNVIGTTETLGRIRSAIQKEQVSRKGREPQATAQVVVTSYNNYNIHPETKKNLFLMKEDLLRRAEGVLSEHYAQSGQPIDIEDIEHKLSPSLLYRLVERDYINTLHNYLLPGERAIANRMQSEDTNLNVTKNTQYGEKTQAALNESSASLSRTTSSYDFDSGVIEGYKYDPLQFEKLRNSPLDYLLTEEADATQVSEMGIKSTLLMKKLLDNNIASYKRPSNKDAQAQGLEEYVVAKPESIGTGDDERTPQLLEKEETLLKEINKIEKSQEQAIASAYNQIQSNPVLNNPVVQISTTSNGSPLTIDGEPVTLNVPLNAEGKAIGPLGRGPRAVYLEQDGVKKYDFVLDQAGFDMASNNIFFQNGELVAENRLRKELNRFPTNISSWNEHYQNQREELKESIDKDIDNFESISKFTGTANSENISTLARMYVDINNDLRNLTKDKKKIFKNLSLRTKYKTDKVTEGIDDDTSQVVSALNSSSEILSKFSNFVKEINAGDVKPVDNLLKGLLTGIEKPFIDTLTDILKTSKETISTSELDQVAPQITNLVNVLDTLNNNSEVDVSILESINERFEDGAYKDLIDNLNGYLENDEVEIVPVAIEDGESYEIAYVPVLKDSNEFKDEYIDLTSGNIKEFNIADRKQYLATIINSGPGKVMVSGKALTNITADQIISDEFNSINRDELVDSIRAFEFESKVGYMHQLERQVTTALNIIDNNLEAKVRGTIAKVAGQRTLSGELLRQLSEQSEINKLQDIIRNTKSTARDSVRSLAEAQKAINERYKQLNKNAEDISKIATREIKLKRAYNRITEAYEKVFKDNRAKVQLKSELEKVKAALELQRLIKDNNRISPKVQEAKALIKSVSLNALGSLGSKNYDTSSIYMPEFFGDRLGLTGISETFGENRTLQIGDSKTIQKMEDFIKMNASAQSILLGVRSVISKLFAGYNTVMGNVVYGNVKNATQAITGAIIDIFEPNDIKTLKNNLGKNGDKIMNELFASMADDVGKSRLDIASQAYGNKKNSEFSTEALLSNPLDDRIKRAQNIKASIANAGNMNASTMNYLTPNGILPAIRSMFAPTIKIKDDSTRTLKQRFKRGATRLRAFSSQFGMANVSNTITQTGARDAETEYKRDIIKQAFAGIINRENLLEDILPYVREVDDSININELYRLRDSSVVDDQLRFADIVDYSLKRRFQDTVAEEGNLVNVITAGARLNTQLQAKDRALLEKMYRGVAQFDADARATSYMVRQVEEYFLLGQAIQTATDRLNATQKEKMIARNALIRHLLDRLIFLILSVGVDHFTRGIQDSMSLARSNTIDKIFYGIDSFWSNALNQGYLKDAMFVSQYRKMKYGDYQAASMERPSISFDDPKSSRNNIAIGLLSGFLPVHFIRQGFEGYTTLYKGNVDQRVVEQNKDGSANIKLEDVFYLPFLNDEWNSRVGGGLEDFLSAMALKDDVIKLEIFPEYSRDAYYKDDDDNKYNLEFGSVFGLPGIGKDISFYAEDGAVYNFQSLKEMFTNKNKSGLQSLLNSKYKKFKNDEITARQYNRQKAEYEQAADLQGVNLIDPAEKESSSSSSSSGSSSARSSR